MTVQLHSEGGDYVPSTWWDLKDFRSHDSADLRCPEFLDVTGRSRYLVYGPYHELSAGLWRATAKIHLCPDAARCRFSLEFGAEPDFSSVDLPFGKVGPLEIEVEHMFREAGQGQIRLFLMRAAFHGEVRFLGATVRQVAEL